MSKNLFEVSSDSEADVIGIKTNQDYAKSYNKFREKELIRKLKDRDKNDFESSSDAESDSSEENLTIDKRFDEQFYKTLSSLKSKNPEIYNKKKIFFRNENNVDEETKKKSKTQKGMMIKDYERKIILEKDGRYEGNDFIEIKHNIGEPPTYSQEQQILRDQIKGALYSDTSEDEFGGIFKRREKTKKEMLREDEEFASWLAGKKRHIEESTAKVLNPLKQYWNNPKLSMQEQFLRDYVLNNGFDDRLIDEVPTYEEVVDDGDHSNDAQELEKQEEFENKYNFRFEEPDQEFIKRYPRITSLSVRRKDERRKEKRAELKDRKLKKKEEKFKELEMLKKIKKKEIQEKILKLKEVTGNDELAFKEDELDDDFDPEAHDRRMREVFNNEYYGVDEGDEKPECPDIDELKVEDWDNYDPNKDDDGDDDGFVPHCEDEDFNMNCDYDPQTAKQSLQNELIENMKNRRKRRRHTQFMEMIHKKKPPFNPEEEKSYGEYIDEYYKMDYEDIICDTPCRFKYVETTPNNFGLTIEEILLAKNKELNQWVSLKKAVQIRSIQAELRDKKFYKMKAKNEVLKRKIFTSIYGPPSEDQQEDPTEKISSISTGVKSVNGNNTDVAKKKRKKKKQSGIQVEPAKHIQSTVPTHTEMQNESHKVADKEQETAHNTIVQNIIPLSTSNKKKFNKMRSKYENTNIQQKILIKSKKLKMPSKKAAKNGKTNFTKIFNQYHKTDDHLYGKISDGRLKAYGITPRQFRRKSYAEKNSLKTAPGGQTEPKNRFQPFCGETSSPPKHDQREKATVYL